MKKIYKECGIERPELKSVKDIREQSDILRGDSRAANRKFGYKRALHLFKRFWEKIRNITRNTKNTQGPVLQVD